MSEEEALFLYFSVGLEIIQQLLMVVLLFFKSERGVVEQQLPVEGKPLLCIEAGP